VTRVVVVAGPGAGSAMAEWSSVTHELSGDATIIDQAQQLTSALGAIHDGPVAADWSNQKFVVPALMDAARRAYGEPVDVHEFPDELNMCGGMTDSRT
jgi:hypothetical protein